jgi:molybdenum-dependent DNA-binding transcriptional regulator ModE
MAMEMSMRYKKMWDLIQKLSKVNWEILNLENR